MIGTIDKCVCIGTLSADRVYRGSGNYVYAANAVVGGIARRELGKYYGLYGNS